jgi:lipopolysaccharide/colanic/teichoic acid biosynthesis glycosyltransferase
VAGVGEGTGRGGRRRVVVHDALMRIVDVVVAGFGVVVLSPLLLGIGAMTRLTMGSPVLFRDERAGRHGKPFTLVKFRTMRPLRPGERSPDSDHVRLTRLGRVLRSTSLDELPTLWNVLRGDMALIGPRPLPVRYLERYSPRQARRHEVRPGITGWAQVHGRNAVGWSERFELDVWYVEHRSLAVDVRILARTVEIVVRRKGISHGEHATMPEFGVARDE